MMLINPYAFGGNVDASENWTGTSPNTDRWTDDVTHFEMGDYSGSYTGNEVRVKAASMPTLRTLTNKFNVTTIGNYRLLIERFELVSEPSTNPDSDYIRIYFPGGYMEYSSNLTAMANDGTHYLYITGEATQSYPFSWPNTMEYYWFDRNGNTFTFKNGNADYSLATTFFTATSAAIGADTTPFAIDTEGTNALGFMTDFVLEDGSGNPLII